MQRRFDLIAFDLDGTLIDNRVAIRDSFNHALATCGFPQLADKKIDSMIGTPLVEMFEKILPDSNRCFAQELVQAFVKCYSQTSHVGTYVLQGVIPTLKRLRDDGFKMAVATTKMNETVHPLLRKIGLYDYFDLTTGRREGMRNKPHPDILDYVMEELDTIPQRTMMVGDTPVDVMMARNARAHAVAVTTGIGLGFTTLDALRDARPDIIIPSLPHLSKNLYEK